MKLTRSRHIVVRVRIYSQPHARLLARGPDAEVKVDQSMNRKRTVWKTSGKFGDIHSGAPVKRDRGMRALRSLSAKLRNTGDGLRWTSIHLDRIFEKHSSDQELKCLPQKHIEGITHLWFYVYFALSVRIPRKSITVSTGFRSQILVAIVVVFSLPCCCKLSS